MRLFFATLATAGLLLSAGCGTVGPVSLPDENRAPVDPERFELVARLVHISDAHIVDEESPGRLTFFAGLSGSAWRAQESFSIQLLDGTIRAVNKLHATRHRIDFLVHTGDSVDNAQFNELRWFIAAFDGTQVNPLTGPDDRAPSDRPEPNLDQHASFTPQGLYRQGVHGDSPTIPWYSVIGNHDRFGIGVFPILVDRFGVRISPLPLDDRVGFFAPKYLDPVGRLSWSVVTPARPGPPFELTIPRPVQANPERRFISDREYVEAHLVSTSEPAGHGFSADHPDRTWYSVSPKPGLRLIALNSSTPLHEVPSLAYADGAISRVQRDFLIEELEKAQAAGEVVIVATHHPSGSLEPAIGTAITPEQFRSLLNRHPNVKLHLAGHLHSNNVIDRGGYIEILTGSVIDFPQRGRIIEIWRPRSFAPAEPAGSGSARATPPDLELAPAGTDLASRAATTAASVEFASAATNPSSRATATPASRAETPLAADFERIEIRYWSFGHYDEIPRPGTNYDDLFEDHHAALRRIAAELAGLDFPDED